MTSDAREHAVGQLEEAVGEENRLCRRYDAAVGTLGESAAYALLHVACDKVVRWKVRLKSIDDNGVGGRMWINGREVGGPGSRFAGLKSRTTKHRDKMPRRDTHTLDLTPGMALSLTRGFLRGVDGHLRDNARDTLALLVTELASNAITHGKPPAELQVTWLAGTARLVVRSGGPPFRWRGPPSPTRAPGGGFGLVLVDRLADRWGIRRSDGGNEVWIELDH